MYIVVPAACQQSHKLLHQLPRPFPGAYQDCLRPEPCCLHLQQDAWQLTLKVHPGSAAHRVGQDLAAGG